MSKMEKEELATRIKAMSTEEKQLALKVFPTELLFNELIRREHVQNNLITSLKSMLKMEE